ncbi:MAG: hypothetical protein IKH12_02825 [Clostridia bacterium]|nr:hypothetical protein [Clostridia bacterium]
MKRRLLSFLLACLLLFGAAFAAFAAQPASPPAARAPLTAANEGKKTAILLTWDPPLYADGMQIFRSETGKRGSYEKIAAVRDRSFFRDGGLRANQIYYYKLRPFTRTPDGYVYGPFESVVGATALTAGFLKKKLNEALTAAHCTSSAEMALPVRKTASSTSDVMGPRM